ncbi:MAG: hypothetical protein IJZ52_05945 [Clostridium sp.]|nr:hypothetical protein [Clostridium sp.]
MKKVWKTVLKLIMATLVCAALVFLNAFVGNTVSALLARLSAQRYVAEEYGHLGLNIDKVGYNFKDGDYYAKVSSPTSEDTYFTIDISMLGRVERDTYESVTGGWNTSNRLNREYRALVKEAASGLEVPYEIDYLTGDLNGSGYGCEWIPEYGLAESELVVDGEYDILELGARHGGLYINIRDEDVSYARGAEILRDIAARMEQAGVPFYAVDFTLQKPKREDKIPEDVSLWLLDFPAKEIGGDGLEQRVKLGHQRTMDYFGEENKLK